MGLIGNANNANNANNDLTVSIFGNRDSGGPFGPISNFPADSLALDPASSDPLDNSTGIDQSLTMPAPKLLCAACPHT